MGCQMNLDILYETTRLTGDQRYATVASKQAEVMSATHIRPDWTTYHVVNIDQTEGKPLEWLTAQGKLLIRPEC